MFNRRLTIQSLVASSVALLANHSHAKSVCEVVTQDKQTRITPEIALEELKSGNERFLNGKAQNCDLRQQILETSKGQAPYAAIVSCIDSRVSPEIVLDQKLGDVFVARVAGNFVNNDILGSLEFATAVSGARLIVVMGHSDCGAIKGAIDDVRLGNLTGLLTNIRPSLERLNYKGVASSKDKQLVQRLAEQNVNDATQYILTKSPVIAKLVLDRKVRVVAAMQDLATGKVNWLV